MPNVLKNSLIKEVLELIQKIYLYIETNPNYFFGEKIKLINGKEIKTSRFFKKIYDEIRPALFFKSITKQNKESLLNIAVNIRFFINQELQNNYQTEKHAIISWKEKLLHFELQSKPEYNNEMINILWEMSFSYSIKKKNYDLFSKEIIESPRKVKGLYYFHCIVEEIDKIARKVDKKLSMDDYANIINYMLKEFKKVTHKNQYLYLLPDCLSDLNRNINSEKNEVSYQKIGNTINVLICYIFELHFLNNLGPVPIGREYETLFNNYFRKNLKIIKETFYELNKIVN